MILASLITMAASTAIGQSTFKLDSDQITVAVNSPKTQEMQVIATAVIPDTFPESATITWTGHENFLTVSSTLSADRKTITSIFKAIKAAPDLKLTAKIGTGEFSQSISATVQPEVSSSTIRLSISNEEKSDGIDLTIGGAKQYRVSLNSGDEIPSSAITVKSDNDTVATATLQGDILTIRGISAGPTNIKIFGYGNPIGNLQINAVAGIELSAIPSKIVVNRNDPKPVELKDALKVDLAKLIISAPVNQEIATINAQNQLIGLKPNGETTFKITVKDVPDRTKDITVAVKAKAEKIVASIPLNDKSLLKGMPTSFTLSVEGDGQQSNDVSVDLATSDASCVSVAKSSRNNFTIRAEKESCTAVKLTATATVEGLASPLKEEFTIVTFAIADFAPLRIRLDVMDDQTAQDLFGKKANDEYIIAKVRLFNAIGRGDANFGKSILVYSESLEVKVGVEWREVDGNGEHAQWRTLDERTASSWFNNAQLTAAPTNKNCTTISQPNLFVPYRPLTFDIVSNTHERRDNRSWRSRIFLALNGFSTLASVVTSVAVPAAGNDIPLGLDKFRNLLIPGVEKLFPSMKEVQRQNITSMVMKPLEEVPFGSDITRILFFPRRTIKGVLVNLPNGTAKRTELRISAVSISDSCAEVGIIDKVNSSPTP